MKRILLLWTFQFLFLNVSLFAQDKADSTTQAKSAAAPSEEEQAAALQKATQNPVANLISVPLQNNTNFSIGPYNRTQDVLNIQPVIPVHITEKWNLITPHHSADRMAAVSQPEQGGEYGLGDMNPTFFLSPAKPGKIIWGAGPAFVIPTATNDVLGQGKFSMGPSFVALAQPKHWTLGAPGQQRVVGRRLRQPSPGEPDAVAILHQLQHEEGLLHFPVADPHRQLAGQQRQLYGWCPLVAAWEES